MTSGRFYAKVLPCQHLFSFFIIIKHIVTTSAAVALGQILPAISETANDLIFSRRGPKSRVFFVNFRIEIATSSK
jgi:hypothetical protein